jgi:hypothetical protein
MKLYQEYKHRKARGDMTKPLWKITLSLLLYPFYFVCHYIAQAIETFIFN